MAHTISTDRRWWRITGPGPAETQRTVEWGRYSPHSERSHGDGGLPSQSPQGPTVVSIKIVHRVCKTAAPLAWLLGPGPCERSAGELKPIPRRQQRFGIPLPWRGDDGQAAKIGLRKVHIFFDPPDSRARKERRASLRVRCGCSGNATSFGSGSFLREVADPEC